MHALMVTGSSERLRFSAILDAFGADRLRTHMAEAKPLHVPAPPGIDPARLYSLAELERTLAIGRVPRANFKAFAGYHNVELDRFGIGGGDFVEPGALSRLSRQRTSFLINEIERVDPGLHDLACEAERALGEPAFLATVVSFDEETGIEPHYDAESLLVVQLEGTKHWRFFGEAVADGARLFKRSRWDPATPVTHEFTLHAGDVLFVPGGLFHNCAPQGFSLHFAFGFRHLGGVALAERLLSDAGEDDALGAPLIRFLGPEAVRTRAEAYRARLIEMLAAADPVELLDRARAARARFDAPDLRTAGLDAPGVRAQIAVTLPPTIRGRQIRAGSTKVAASPEMVALVESLAAGPVAVSELRLRFGDAADRAIRSLMDAGIVRLLAGSGDADAIPLASRAANA